jgi:PAS domain S-box-containing protein
MRQLAAIVESTDDAIVGLDADGVVLTWNTGAERMFGYPADAVVGSSAARLLPPEREDELELLLDRVWRGERIAHYATVGMRRDARPIDLSLTLTPTSGADGEPSGASLIARDVTERKRVGEQLRQAQRLEAVTRLADGVAQELATLVAAVDAEADVLLDRLAADDPLRFQVSEMRRAADRAAGLTRQLHAFGGRQPVDTRVVDLNELVASCESTLRPLLGDGIALDVHLGRGLGRVEGDPAALEHALLTLAENAREAMPSGGRVVVETANVELSEEVAREHLRLAPGRYVLLTVRDTGAGMDEETRSRAFEPFFTTRADGEAAGRGLGLSRVYGIVDQAGGSIGLESRPGAGTSVRIYLPRVERAADSLARPADDPLHGNETILLVEDDPIVRSLVRRLLSEYGYRVVVAENGSEALVLCETYRGPIDLLLTDVVMPDIGGREVAERVAALRPETSVVYTSGYAGDVLESQGGLDPHVAFLEKPFSREKLAHIVRATLDARGLLREAESIARRSAA